MNPSRNEDVADERLGGVGFSPRGSAVFAETWAKAHATKAAIGLVWYALVACVCLAMTSVVHAETTQTIEEFVAQKSKWSSLEMATLQLEGRYSILSPSQLRMEKCDLEFVLARSFPRPAGDSKNILIKGRIEKRDTKLVFVVSDLLPQVSDVDNFRALRGKVPSSKPAEWYKLAEWGSHRAKYYHDDELKKEATDAFRQGVLAEHRALSPATPMALRTLAQKLSTWGADPALQLEYRHEALWADFETIRQDNTAGDGELMTELAKQIPGTDQPLTADVEPARALYLKSPRVAFQKGDSDLRKKYARAFYVEILKNRILRDATADGKNGYSIASRIEQQLPEYRSLGPQYRLQEQQYHLGRVGALTRKEMTELVAKFEPLKVPEFVQQLKSRWLAEKEKQVDPQSASALVDVGDDYLIILGNPEAAIRFYQKAYVLSPNTQAISDWLTEQGLVLYQGAWIPKGRAPAKPVDLIAAAVREGQVREGMTTEQVKSALGVEPTRKTRIATSGHVQEWWLYEDHGLSIQFTRRRRPEAALVTKVMTLTAKPSPVKVVPGKPGGTADF